MPRPIPWLRLMDFQVECCVLALNFEDVCDQASQMSRAEFSETCLQGACDLKPVRAVIAGYASESPHKALELPSAEVTPFRLFRWLWPDRWKGFRKLIR